MQIDRFEEGFSAEYLTAAHDETVGILSVTFFPPSKAGNDENEYLLGLANGVLSKVDTLKPSIKAEFLGATRIGKTFPSLAFSFKANADALKVRDALSGHLAGYPAEGYSICYSELK